MSVREKPNGRKQIAEKLLPPLREMSGYEFTVNWFPSPVFHWACVRTEPDYPAKTPDGREIGTMFLQAEFRHIYFDSKRRIKWPDDWIDPYQISIDRVSIYEDHVDVRILKDFDLYFMCKAYYATLPVTAVHHKRYVDFFTMLLEERANRMKAGKFIPAAIKDIEFSLKSITDILHKHNIDRSEAEFDFPRFGLRLRFPTHDMNHQEILENVMSRAIALAEHRKRFRLEWLPSEKRRERYESTMLFREDPFRKTTPMRYVCKLPFESQDDQLNREVEEIIRSELGLGYKPQIYNLDGSRLRLVGHEIYKDEKGIKRVKGGRIILDKRSKLKPFPLEKIEFLKEDFPELFGGDC